MSTLRAASAASCALLAACLASCGTTGQDRRIVHVSDNSGYVVTAQARVAQNYRGTIRKPDPSSRPATKGKKVAVISIGMQSITSKTPSLAAIDAGRSL